MAYGKKPRLLADRLSDLVSPEPTSGCWLWVGGVDADGYGLVTIGSRSDGSRRNGKAHRLSYEIANGPIPDGLSVCHSCDQPGCINPRHLWLGTTSENLADRDRKGRGAWQRKAAKSIGATAPPNEVG